MLGNVREVIHGPRRLGDHPVDGLTARQLLNDHYAAVSTDSEYCASKRKLIAADCADFITEFAVFFRILDTLRHMATGNRRHLGAPIFAATLIFLFNKSLAYDVLPLQWKTPVIAPIPKVPEATQPREYRPIYIKPVLSRCMGDAL